VEPESSAVLTGEEDTGTQPTTQQQDRYGLMGKPNQAIANGYTIVVHSLRDRQQAEQNRQQLQQAGYRALISQAQVEGTTYYRVGIGQFETVGDAQQAIGDIPERYRDNNFIKRIQ
jgi:cell division septation protein DedD